MTNYRPLEFMPESTMNQFNGTKNSRNPLDVQGSQPCLVIHFVTSRSITVRCSFCSHFISYDKFFSKLLLLKYLFVITISFIILGLMQRCCCCFLWCLLCAFCWWLLLILVICARLANIMRMSSKILFHPFWSVLSFLKRVIFWDRKPYTQLHRPRFISIYIIHTKPTNTPTIRIKCMREHKLQQQQKTIDKGNTRADRTKNRKYETILIFWI